jgi:hypothetical protein
MVKWEMGMRRVDPTLVFFLSHHPTSHHPWMDPKFFHFAFQPLN